MWGFLASKIGGSVIGSFLAPFKLWIIIGAVSVFVGSVWLYYHNAEKAKAMVVYLEAKLEIAERNARTNAGSFLICQSANKKNALEATEQRLRADQAEGRVRVLVEQANSTVEVIQRETETFRTELTCPALTPDFKRWVRGS